MFVCEKHRSFSIGDALKMQAKNECHVCEISTLRAQLSALREHLSEFCEMEKRRPALQMLNIWDATISAWLEKASEILGGE
jgi:hypothetical protein